MLSKILSLCKQHFTNYSDNDTLYNDMIDFIGADIFTVVLLMDAINSSFSYSDSYNNTDENDTSYAYYDKEWKKVYTINNSIHSFLSFVSNTFQKQNEEVYNETISTYGLTHVKERKDLEDSYMWKNTKYSGGFMDRNLFLRLFDAILVFEHPTDSFMRSMNGNGLKVLDLDNKIKSEQDDIEDEDTQMPS
jgi:hypothetical protein